jgi:hypothetical protein
MRRVILWFILTFGRFATLPVSVAGLALLAGWLALLEAHFLVAALVLAPVVIPFAIASVALVAGLLLLPERSVAAGNVDDSAAPGLWAIWDEFDSSPRRTRRLCITDDLNAAISERWAYAPPFRRRLTMRIGFPLLLVLDAPAMRAIIAHEVAHARLQHTSGGANLADFINAVDNLLDYSEGTVTAYVADLLLESLLAYLHKENMALSRQNELAADRHAEACVDPVEIARSLALMVAAQDILRESVIEPLEQELLGAIRAPAPPMQRIVEQLPALRDPDRVNAAIARLVQAPHEPDQTHPSLCASLENLGFATPPRFAPALTCAGDSLLSPGSLATMVAGFDTEWTRCVSEHVKIH